MWYSTNVAQISNCFVKVVKKCGGTMVRKYNTVSYFH